jgi:hypothetical protein
MALQYYSYKHTTMSSEPSAMQPYWGSSASAVLLAVMRFQVSNSAKHYQLNHEHFLLAFMPSCYTAMAPSNIKE